MRRGKVHYFISGFVELGGDFPEKSKAPVGEQATTPLCPLV